MLLLDGVAGPKHRLGMSIDDSVVQQLNFTRDLARPFTAHLVSQVDRSGQDAGAIDIGAESRKG